MNEKAPAGAGAFSHIFLLEQVNRQFSSTGAVVGLAKLTTTASMGYRFSTRQICAVIAHMHTSISFGLHKML
jgi:hypothetical protein